jgi:hypothetical protein
VQCQFAFNEVKDGRLLPVGRSRSIVRPKRAARRSRRPFRLITPMAVSARSGCDRCRVRQSSASTSKNACELSKNNLSSSRPVPLTRPATIKERSLRQETSAHVRHAAFDLSRTEKLAFLGRPASILAATNVSKPKSRRYLRGALAVSPLPPHSPMTLFVRQLHDDRHSLLSWLRIYLRSGHRR